MSKLSRRQVLIFFAGAAGAIVADQVLGSTVDAREAKFARLSFTPVRLPHPLPIYKQQKNYLPTEIGQGKTFDASPDVKLASYNVLDDVVVPPEFERYVIVGWGDRVFPNPEDYFGYNNDYTGFVPIDQHSLNDGYLWVNHEYISYPFSELAPATPTDLTGFPTTYPLVIGGELPNDKTSIELLGEFLYNLGGSVVRIARANRNENYTVVHDANNRRIHGLSGLAINRDRSDDYKNITSWGSKSYQQGDENYLIGTGPAATSVFNISSDGLGNRIIGTAYNCSGGTSPWGTIVSGEENFQGSSSSFVGVTESVKLNGTQTGYTAGTTGEKFGLVGEKYGWMVEINPADPNFRPRKHTALGRFRHENIAIRAEAGSKLVVYMGDDRRGGHTWKFVSNGTVVNPNNKNNSKLFEDGTLYVAVYNADGTGRWLPLTLQTPTNPNRPSVLSSVEAAARGTISNNGNTRFPKLPDGGANIVTVANEATELPQYEGKTLGEFYPNQGALLSDAFQAANLAGGTPTARPEDIEIHPYTKEVFISYTDAAPSSDGYADSRIFVVSKYSSNVNATQHFGGLYKIIEDSQDGTGTTFRWQRFAQGGEAGAELGAGFALSDNLVFDNQGNLWVVIDIPNEAYNGFNSGAAGTPNVVDHTQTGNVTTLLGAFGNSWMFFIPTRGPNAGNVIPFGHGPMRCEFTGPTFVGDTLIVSVQHPGEDCPINDGTTFSRDIELLDLDGSLFMQKRTIPRGSSWPSNIPTADGGSSQATGIPRPAVIGIRRKNSKGRFI
ncbi:MAG: PhoX family phosphatase [Iphinoe sp. HA4291-MV1]|jgi:hypothetical protein|nr:PhoX family phosphatase [Iphinoe sp. HA4291-MV1]